MWSTLKTVLTSILLFIAMCFGANAAVTENHTLGDFLAAQHYINQNPEANQLASLENFDFFQKHASECCNAPNRTSAWEGVDTTSRDIGADVPDNIAGWVKGPDGSSIPIQKTANGQPDWKRFFKKTLR